MPSLSSMCLGFGQTRAWEAGSWENGRRQGLVRMCLLLCLGRKQYPCSIFPGTVRRRGAARPPLQDVRSLQEPSPFVPLPPSLYLALSRRRSPEVVECLLLILGAADGELAIGFFVEY